MELYLKVHLFETLNNCFSCSCTLEMGLSCLVIKFYLKISASLDCSIELFQCKRKHLTLVTYCIDMYAGCFDYWYGCLVRDGKSQSSNKRNPPMDPWRCKQLFHQCLHCTLYLFFTNHVWRFIKLEGTSWTELYCINLHGSYYRRYVLITIFQHA